MPNIPQSELPKPKSWDEFEDIVWDLYVRLWQDPHADRYGRAGQRQDGVDIVGRPHHLDRRYAGIQCKRYAEGTLSQAIVEREVANAESFVPALAEYIIATTDARDATLQSFVLQMNEERQATGKFAVQIAFWDTLSGLLTHPDNRDLLHKYYDDWLASALGTNASVPIQRPPRAEYFTGREKELAQLLTSLKPGQVITLCGPGGIGKTALAAEALWTLTPNDEAPDYFPDGIIYYSFYSRPGVDIAVEHIVRSFDEAALDTSLTAVHRLLSRKRALLVLDGTEEADNLQALLQVRGICGVLVISRRRRDTFAGRIDLRPLELKEAITLLQAWGEEQNIDESTAHRICEAVGCLPLAVRLVGRYLDQTSETAAEYLAWLEEAPIQALSHGEHRLESVERQLGRSLEHVSGEAREILAVVGLLAPAPFAAESVLPALRVSLREVRLGLGELVSYGLLLRNNAGYEVSHALVHTYARGCLVVSREVVRRLAAHYAIMAAYLIDTEPGGHVSLDVEHPHMMAILARCLKEQDWEATIQLALAAHRHLGSWGYWTDRVIMLSSGLAAARQLRHRQWASAFLVALGPAYRALGQVEKAVEYHKEALRIARIEGDRRGEGIQLSCLGNAYRDLGQAERAIEFYKQALAIARKADGWHDESIQLSCLGNVYRDLGQTEAAIRYYQQALEIAQRERNRRGESVQLSCLGNAYRDLGQVEQGIEFYEQALAIARDIADQHDECIQLSCLGNAYRDLGEIESAIEYYQQALAISRRLRDRKGETIQLGGLGLAYYELGQVEQAIAYHQQALEVAREMGDRRREGLHLGNLGLAYVESGEVEQAIECYQQSLSIAREVGDRQGEGSRLEGLGLICCEQGQIERASVYLRQALTVFEEIQSPRAEQVQQMLDRLLS